MVLNALLCLSLSDLYSQTSHSLVRYEWNANNAIRRGQECTKSDHLQHWISKLQHLYSYTYLHMSKIECQIRCRIRNNKNSPYIIYPFDTKCLLHRLASHTDDGVLSWDRLGNEIVFYVLKPSPVAVFPMGQGCEKWRKTNKQKNQIKIIVRFVEWNTKAKYFLSNELVAKSNWTLERMEMCDGQRNKHK